MRDGRLRAFDGDGFGDGIQLSTDLKNQSVLHGLQAFESFQIGADLSHGGFDRLDGGFPCRLFPRFFFRGTHFRKQSIKMIRPRGQEFEQFARRKSPKRTSGSRINDSSPRNTQVARFHGITAHQ